MSFSHCVGLGAALIGAALAQAQVQPRLEPPVIAPPPPVVAPPPAALPEVPPLPDGDHYLVKGEIRGLAAPGFYAGREDGDDLFCHVHAGFYICALPGLGGRTLTPRDQPLHGLPALRFEPSALRIDCGPQNRCAHGEYVKGPALQVRGRAERFQDKSWLLLECAERWLPTLRPFSPTYNDRPSGFEKYDLTRRAYQNGWQVAVVAPAAGQPVGAGHVFLGERVEDATLNWHLLGEMEALNRDHCQDW